MAAHCHASESSLELMRQAAGRTAQPAALPPPAPLHCRRHPLARSVPHAPLAAHASPPQVDLSMEPHRREAMLAGSDGLSKLPQLHVNGRYVGGADDIQAGAGCWAFDQLVGGLSASECRHIVRSDPPWPLLLAKKQQQPGG